jgi:rhamnogalacturonyl hydrolase YesR
MPVAARQSSWRRRESGRSLWASSRVAGWAPLAGAELLLIVPAMALASITLAGRLDP